MRSALILATWSDTVGLNALRGPVGRHVQIILLFKVINILFHLGFYLYKYLRVIKPLWVFFFVLFELLINK